MTLRHRNKIILGLFYITFAFFLLYIGLFVFSIITQKLTFPEISNISNKSTFFLFKYSPYAIIVSCFIEVIFSCVILRTIYRSFEKTQSTQILYLSLFFLSIAIDSCRIFIPLFNLNNIFSKQINFIGHALIFSKFLSLLSLALTNYSNPDEPIQNNERTCIVIIVVSLFFSFFIPINNTSILQNYSVSYGYYNTINKALFIIIILNCISLFFYNKENDYSQITTISFTVMSIGYYYLIFATSIFELILSATMMGFGIRYYIKELHDQYLLYD